MQQTILNIKHILSEYNLHIFDSFLTFLISIIVQMCT